METGGEVVSFVGAPLLYTWVVPQYFPARGGGIHARYLLPFCVASF